MTQITLASLPYLTKKKKTRREQFLEEMDKAQARYSLGAV